MQDVVIIGAGIIGSFLAHDLSKYDLKVCVIDKENDVANETTMANSAIVHSGHDPKDDTLKAKLNLRGNEMYEDICKKLHVDFKRIGAYVVATNDEELEELSRLYEQSKRRNVPVRYVEREELVKNEPNISDIAIRAIDLPSTGIIYPWEVAIALMEVAVANGVDLHLGEEVTAIEKSENGYKVITSKGVIETKYVLNAAGVFADDIYRMVSDNVEFDITPRKGEYFVLDKLNQPLVNHILYPIPSQKGKGVLVLPTTHGNTLLGPSSDFVDDKKGINNTSDYLGYVRREVGKLVKNVPMDKVIRNFAGLRPTSSTHDFIIEEAKDAPNFINVAGIESPGLASAPAISEYVIETILKNKLALVKKSDAIDSLPPITDMKKLTEEERNAKIKEDPRYGHIICRCEQISEGEIVEAIHRNVGATSVKSIKKRVRPGMGRCQGGFCEPLVVEILARELAKQKNDIVYDDVESNVLVAKKGA
ncbi:MAG: NAD(P)/FAD-dependent oxidoreductase [Erysipelotrichales bacterium]|nr:NAD(P)/FAD-dependent oxidoreductase [Erysipelotrichales bacterium]